MKTEEAPDHQAGADYKDKRYRNLHNYDDAPKMPVMRSYGAASGPQSL